MTHTTDTLDFVATLAKSNQPTHELIAALIERFGNVDLHHVRCEERLDGEFIEYMPHSDVYTYVVMDHTQESLKALLALVESVIRHNNSSSLNIVVPKSKTIRPASLYRAGDSEAVFGDWVLAGELLALKKHPQALVRYTARDVYLTPKTSSELRLTMWVILRRKHALHMPYILQQHKGTHGVALTATYAGIPATGRFHTKAHKEGRKHLGKMMRDIMLGRDLTQATVNEAITLADSLGLQSNVVDAINYEHDLVFDQCYDCDEWTDTGDMCDTTGGVRICADCRYNDDYVYLQDRGVFGREEDSYRHSCGEWYSYPEEREEDSAEDHPDMYSYSTNVVSIKGKEDIKESKYGDFLMGVEIELESDVDGYCFDDIVQDTIGQLGYACILKPDGSLSDYGIEIVSRPQTLKTTIKMIDGWYIHSGLYANEDCGIHVHISRAGLTKMTEGKMLAFVNRDSNEDLIRDIAGRYDTEYARKERFSDIDNPQSVLNSKAEMRRRYALVNTSNHSTVELRMFASSTNTGTIKARIEFAHALVMFCRWASYKELDEGMFMQWLYEVRGEYPSLCKLLKYRIEEVAPVKKLKKRKALAA